MADSANPEIRKAGTWVTVWGVLLIIAGIIAIIEPAPAALAADLLISWLFVFVGCVQIFYAIQQRAAPGLRMKLLSAVLTLVLGIFLVSRPLIGIASLALLIGAFLLISGISNVMLGFRLKPAKGWGWVLFDGLLSIVIAFLIASGWPQSSIGFVGVLVGVLMIYGGLWRIMLGSALRSGPVPG